MEALEGGKVGGFWKDFPQEPVGLAKLLGEGGIENNQR